MLSISNESMLSIDLTGVDFINLGEGALFRRVKECTNEAKETFKCSQCGKHYAITEVKYCPWCGSKVVKRSNDVNDLFERCKNAYARHV